MEPAANSAHEAHYVPWVAASVPLAYYVAGATSHGGFFEEGSFVAAARQLSVPYPPGAPIQSLLSAAFALLPVGPLAFRVAVASAVCAALTLALFSRALLSTLRHVGVTDPRIAAPLALATTFWLSQTPLFFQQAVRPHVFSLQLALSMLIIYTLLRFEAEEPHGTTRVLYFGAFVQGLCFANHHVYGLLMLPVAAPTLGRVFARRGFIGLMGHMVAPIVGFSAYLYVPLRLAHDPDTSLAGESGAKRLLAILSAEPYAGPSWSVPVPVLSVLRTGLSLQSRVLLLGLVGLVGVGMWVTLRSSHRRRFGTLWFLTSSVPLASAAFAIQPKLLEDTQGVLLPSACGLLAIACCGAGALLSFLSNVAPPRLARAISLLVLSVGALGLLRQPGAGANTLAELGDRLDDLTRRNLAPRAVLLATDAGSAFRHQGREAEEHLRPDITLVPLALAALPHAVDDWARRHPELTDSLRSWVLDGQLDPGSLQSLSATRPVYLEPNDETRRGLYETTLDEGLLLRVVSDGTTPVDLRGERGNQAKRLGQLYPLPAGSHAAAPSALLKLGRAHLFQAMQRAALGDLEGARDYLQLSQKAGFHAARQASLAAALQRGQKLDVDHLTPAGGP